MGGINSRRMDSEHDSNIIAILHYLARSGNLHRIDNQTSDDSDEEYSANSQSRFSNVPNTDRLDKHEISLATKQACGIMDISDKVSIMSMIQRRSIGPAFSLGERCRIGNIFLPNKMDQIAKYNSKIYCGSYSKDGKLFLTASQDKWLRVYHTYDGDFVQFKRIPARDVGWSILDTAFSPDGNTIVYSSWSECLYQCPVYGDSNTQESLSLCPGMRRFCVFSLVFSNDGREILGGANDGNLYVYDRECHQRVFRIEGHEDDVNAVAFADSTSQIFYSAGDDGLCKVWDKRTLTETDPRPVGVLAGHMDGITYIDSRGDSRYLITNCKDQTIKLWDVRAFSGDIGETNTRKAVSGQNWDYRWQRVPKRMYRKALLEGDTSVMTYRGHSVLQTLVRCRFSPAATTGQRYIYTGCSSGRIVIYDLLTGKIVRSLLGHSQCVRDVSWHPFHPQFISTSWDGAIARWFYGKDVNLETNATCDDYEEDHEHEHDHDHDHDMDIQPRMLRRSERIAARRARHAALSATL